MDRQAACWNESPAGLGTRLTEGTATCSASVPSYLSDSRVRAGSRVSSPAQPGEATTAWMITSLPASSTPAPSQPKTIGSLSAARPTPCRDHTSWWFSPAARSVTTDQPGRETGSGRWPMTNPDNGSEDD